MLTCRWFRLLRDFLLACTTMNDGRSSRHGRGRGRRSGAASKRSSAVSRLPSTLHHRAINPVADPQVATITTIQVRTWGSCTMTGRTGGSNPRQITLMLVGSEDNQLPRKRSRTEETFGKILTRVLARRVLRVLASRTCPQGPRKKPACKIGMLLQRTRDRT